MVDDTYTLEAGDTIQAFDRNIEERTLHGYGVTDGAAVTINTGTLGSGSDTLTANSGSVLVGGGRSDVAAQPLDLPGADDLPRWDIVGVNSSGSVIVRSGTPEQPQINGSETEETHRTVHKPVPPSVIVPDQLTALALVWVPAGADSITDEDLFDVRAPANAALEDLNAASISGPIAGGETVTDITGSNLFVNNGALSSANMRTDLLDDGAETTTNTTDINFGTNLTVTDGTPPTVDGNYEIQVDGTDGEGIINFHTQ